jgi:NADPH-dependent curcumin reductase CurA
VSEPGDDGFAWEEHPVRETIVDSIERAPSAFRGMLAGRNVGRQLVRLATPD